MDYSSTWGWASAQRAFAFLCVLLAAPAGAQPAAWRVASGEVTVLCPLTVGGSFEAKTSGLTGELRVDAA